MPCPSNPPSPLLPVTVTCWKPASRNSRWHRRSKPAGCSSCKICNSAERWSTIALASASASSSTDASLLALLSDCPSAILRLASWKMSSAVLSLRFCCNPFSVRLQTPRCDALMKPALTRYNLAQATWFLTREPPLFNVAASSSTVTPTRSSTASVTSDILPDPPSSLNASMIGLKNRVNCGPHLALLFVVVLPFILL